MPLSRISDECLPVGTVLKEGMPEQPVYYAVASVEPMKLRAFGQFRQHSMLQQWRMKLRAATEEEKTLADVMQT